MVKAAELLAAEGVEVTVLSVTSWSELARDGVACEQRALSGEAEHGTPWLTQQLAGNCRAGDCRHRLRARRAETVRSCPKAAATSPWAPTALAAATRAALRQFFGVDAQAVAKAARFALGLAQNGCWRLMDKRQQLLKI